MSQNDSKSIENLAINKSQNPILYMQTSANEASDSPGNTIVISNQWKNTVSKFPGVAFVKNKFGL